MSVLNNPSSLSKRVQRFGFGQGRMSSRNIKLIGRGSIMSVVLVHPNMGIDVGIDRYQIP